MSFDIASYCYCANACRVVDDDVDSTAFERNPLPEPALRALQYMSDVESHTICYLRDLLVTPSHQDPELTTFLIMWAYEEFSRAARLLTRIVLRVLWTPVGSGSMPATETEFLLRYLMGDCMPWSLMCFPSLSR